jgi:hypothetical protein
MTHPLLDVMLDAARGEFPPVDGAVTFLPGLPGGNRAIVALTGHAFIAADLDAGDFDGIELDGFGAALAPAAVLRVAGDGRIGVNDVTLVARGTSRGTSAPTTTAWDDHPRVRYARRLRSNVVVRGDERGFVTLSEGLAGRTEMSIELADPAGSSGSRPTPDPRCRRWSTRGRLPVRGGVARQRTQPAFVPRRRLRSHRQRSHHRLLAAPVVRPNRAEAPLRRIGPQTRRNPSQCKGFLVREGGLELQSEVCSTVRSDPGNADLAGQMQTTVL